MEILFCDICNESVPLPDVHAGRASVRKGRVVCAQCDLAMGGEKGPEIGESTIIDGGAGLGAGAGLPASSGAAVSAVPVAASAGALGFDGPDADASARPARRPRENPGAGGMLIGLAALIVAAAGLWLVIERVDALERTVRVTDAELRSDVDGAQRARAGAAADTNARIEDLRTALIGQGVEFERLLGDRLEALDGSITAQTEQLADAARDIDRLRLRLETVGSDAERARQSDAARIAKLEEELLFVRDELIRIDEHIRIVAVSGPAPAAVPTPVAEDSGKAWERFLPDLKSDEEGIRVDAVIALGDTRDPDTVPHLLPMLDDSNLFVRMVAADALGKIADPAAVPRLIETLEDERPAVRESALYALRAITGEDLGFDPTGSEGDRSKRVKAWRDWWSKNRSRLLGA